VFKGTTKMPNIYEKDGISVTIALFTDLKNAKSLKQKVIDGEFETTLLNTKMVKYVVVISYCIIVRIVVFRTNTFRDK